MWADAALIHHGLAKRNPLRWSPLSSIEDTIRSLEEHGSSSPERPVTVQLHCNAYAERSELEQTYPTIENAVSGLQQYLAALTSSSNDSKRLAMSAEAVSMLWHVFRIHLAIDSTVTVRWTQDKFVWFCNWSSLEVATQNLKDLEMSSGGQAEEVISVSKLQKKLTSFVSMSEGPGDVNRPVILQIKMATADGPYVKFLTTTATVTLAISFLQEVHDVSNGHDLRAIDPEVAGSIQRALEFGARASMIADDGADIGDDYEDDCEIISDISATASPTVERKEDQCVMVERMEGGYVMDLTGLKDTTPELDAAESHTSVLPVYRALSNQSVGLFPDALPMNSLGPYPVSSVSNINASLGPPTASGRITMDLLQHRDV